MPMWSRAIEIAVGRLVVEDEGEDAVELVQEVGALYRSYSGMILRSRRRS